MIQQFLTVVIIGSLLSCPALADDFTYDRENRSRYIDQILEALQVIPSQPLINLQNYVHAVDRGQCHSAHADLQVNCLLEAAKQNCDAKKGGLGKQEHCYLASDVVVTNQLGEKAFIDSRTKYNIMRKHTDYRKELVRELHRHYARLVLEFGLSRDLEQAEENLGSGIDSYCGGVADTRRISWQYCVAAIVWFMRSPQRQRNGGRGQGEALPE